MIQTPVNHLQKNLEITFLGSTADKIIFTSESTRLKRNNEGNREMIEQL